MEKYFAWIILIWSLHIWCQIEAILNILSWQNFEFHANFASEVLLEVEYNMPIAQSISYILSF